MASSLSTLRSKLRTQLKIDTGKNIWSDATLDLYINNAYGQIQRDGDYDWRENIGGSSTPTIVSGTAEYTAPTDMARIDLVLFGDNELKITTKEDVKRKEGATISQGEPSHYYIQGSIIGLYPTPNTIKTTEIIYRKRLTELSSDSDAIDFNTDFDQALINYAAYLAWSGYRGASGNSQVEQQLYEKQMETLRQTYLVFSQENLKFNTQIAPVSSYYNIPRNTR